MSSCSSAAGYASGDFLMLQCYMNESLAPHKAQFTA